jgi:hypothetical protein
MPASQRVATVLLSAGFVAAAIPVMFFTLVLPLEHAAFLREAGGYVDSWCWCRLLVSLAGPEQRASGAAWLAASAKHTEEQLAAADTDAHANNKRTFVRGLVLAGACSGALVLAAVLTWAAAGTRWSLLGAVAEALLVVVTFSLIELATVAFLISRYRTDPYASNIVVIDAVLAAAALQPAGSTEDTEDTEE